MAQDVKKESYYHAALVMAKKVQPTTFSGNDRLTNLLEHSGSFENIYNNINGNLFGEENFDYIKKKLEKVDFSMITILDDDYPMRDLEGAPPVLYYQGNLDLLKEKSIAVVGTRDLEDSEDIAEGEGVLERLLNKNYVIVSGLAEGCDTLAHKYSIENGGKTIAVLGTPLDRYYPKKNKELQQKIAEEHLLVSQYPIGIDIFPAFFAHRNITTVGLSTEGIVVIKSPDKSGTQHAIRHCLKQDKTLYVLKNNAHYDWVMKKRDKLKLIKGRNGDSI